MRDVTHEFEPSLEEVGMITLSFVTVFVGLFVLIVGISLWYGAVWTLHTLIGLALFLGVWHGIALAVAVAGTLLRFPLVWWLSQDIRR